MVRAMYPDSILRQFIYETENWSRLVAFLKQENVSYKSRLAEVVNEVDDEGAVAEAEKFNEDFLSQDGIVDFLTEQLKSQNQLLQKDLHLHPEWLKDVITCQKKLRTDIEKAEKIFSGTKRNFDSYLDSLL